MVSSTTPVAERVERGAERAAGGDLGELVVVTDEDHLGADLRRLLDDRGEVAGAGHRRFVDHDQRAAADLALLDEVTGDRRRRDAGAVLQLACRPRRRSEPDDLPASRFVESADGSERVGLAGARSADEHGDRVPGRGQTPDGLSLIVPQRRRGDRRLDDGRVEHTDGPFVGAGESVEEASLDVEQRPGRVQHRPIVGHRPPRRVELRAFASSGRRSRRRPASRAHG